jgi:CheY-like chemotaxis protein
LERLMKKILLVEDDAVVARIYSLKLTAAGFDVMVARDGLEAMKQLPVARPELVVLDILMPKVNGVDVLGFIRGHPELKATRVIVFSNAFLNNVGQKLLAMGVDDMLLKSSVTPKQLIEKINTILKSVSAKHPPDETAFKEDKPGHEDGRESAADFGRRIRREFFDRIPTLSQFLKEAANAFCTANDSLDRSRQLEHLSRRVGFLTHMTGMAGCHRIAQLSSAFEALLFELQETPSNINDSSLHTVASAVELLVNGLARADQADEQCLSPTSILVVDDDAVSNRALLFALGRYRLKAVSVLDPFSGLEKLRHHRYDVVLLDINLPGMDGIQMCERMRLLPLHDKTPVIFLTSYMEFEQRVRAILRGGDDLIAKPVLPIELTVKVIALTLKRRLPATVPTS